MNIIARSAYVDTPSDSEQGSRAKSIQLAENFPEQKEMRPAYTAAIPAALAAPPAPVVCAVIAHVLRWPQSIMPHQPLPCVPFASLAASL